MCGIVSSTEMILCSKTTHTLTHTPKYLHCYKIYKCNSFEYNKHNLISVIGYRFTAQHCIIVNIHAWQKNLQYYINNRIPEICLQTNHIKRLISSCLHLCTLNSDFGGGDTAWQPPTLEWAPAMTEHPLSLSDHRIGRHVTVSLWGMIRASSTQGAVEESENGGQKTEECICHSLYVCNKLYQTGQHPLFLCERIGCTVSHNKPPMPLSRHVDHKFILGRGRGSAPDIIYNLCLILKTMFVKIKP